MLILDIASLALIALGCVALFRRDSLPAHALLLAGVTAGAVGAIAEHFMAGAITNAVAVGYWAFRLTQSVRRRLAAE